MNTEIKTVNRFGESGFDGEQAKSMVAGIDDLPVESTVALREHFDHCSEATDHRFDAFDRCFDAIDRRFDALESSLRSLQNLQIISLISILATTLAGSAGLLFALLSRS